MYLLDTNVVSELRKANTPNIDSNVESWAKTVPVGELHISVISVQEIQTGIDLKMRKDEVQAIRLQEWFNENVLKTFENRIVPIDEAIALVCAKLHVPNKRPYADSLIAASANHHNMTLVTRNVGDFEGLTTKLLNPWDNV